MTNAVCIQCGQMKFGAWCPCPACGFDSVTIEDRARQLMLTDHYYGMENLRAIGAWIAQEHDWPIGQMETEKFLSNFRPLIWEEEHEEETSQFLAEFRLSKDPEELKFFDSLPEPTQIVTARLDLLEKYSNRLEAAFEKEGMEGVRKEFECLRSEVPQLSPLRLIEDGNRWHVEHPNIG